MKKQKNLGLGTHKTINRFVEAKLQLLDQSEPDFSSLFELMFSESENRMYEKSEGYRMQITTYGEAKEEIYLLAATLKQRLDLPDNAVVGLSMENSLLWIELFWAILLCGWCPLLMNLRLSDDVLEQALKDSHACAVLSDQRSYSFPTIDTKELVKTEPPWKPRKFGEEILVMSSGTSDHIKICAYSAKEFRCQIHDSYHLIQKCSLFKRHYDGYLKLLTFLPFYHVFGLIAMYIWFAFFSRTFVHLNDMTPQTIVNTIKRHKVTHIFAVPLFWETVYDQAIKTIRGRGQKTYRKFQKGMKLSRKLSGMTALSHLFSRTAFKEVRENLFGESICILITGGSAIRPEVMEFFNAIGYRLADGYGMTEIGITSVELSNRPKILNACFVGKPMTYAEYSINDDGELLVRGKVVARYIIENGQKTMTDPEKWFNTHDLAECVRGEYRILGRTDDLIVSSNGENLNPNLYEPQLSIEGTNGVCIIPSKDTPVLLVSVNRYCEGSQLEQLDSRLKDKLTELHLTGQLGRIVYISDKLMLGDEFKLNRKRLREDYAAGKLRQVTPDSAADREEEDELMRTLRQMMAAVLEKDLSEISPETDFFLDLGGTSLDYMALTARLQEDYGVSFLRQDDQTLRTAEEFYQYMKENSKSC